MPADFRNRSSWLSKLTWTEAIDVLVDNIQAIRFVAERLGSLVERVIFLGGATVGLLVTEHGAARPRATKDVDIILEMTSRMEYLDGSLRADLQDRGFREVLGEGVICRWQVDDVKVDIVDTSGSIFGSVNRWYPAAAAQSTRHSFDQGPTIRLISAACFLATKLEAFGNRGGGDYQASHDLEDIVSVIDGRGTIEEDIRTASLEVRGFLGREARRLLEVPAFVEALPGHLSGDPAGQGRLAGLLGRLRRISETR